MASVLALLGLVVLVAVQAGIAAVLTRVFRVRLATRWGAVVYTVLVTPVVLLATTLLLTGFLGLGPDLGDAATAVFVMIGIPLAIGVTVDYLWMPAPDDVDLPDAHR